MPRQFESPLNTSAYFLAKICLVMVLRSALRPGRPRPDHHRRVRRVGAGGDRGNDHVAVAEVVVAAFDRNALRRAGLGEILVERGGERGMEVEDLLAAVAALVELLL